MKFFKAVSCNSIPLNYFKSNLKYIIVIFSIFFIALNHRCRIWTKLLRPVHQSVCSILSLSFVTWNRFLIVYSILRYAAPANNNRGQAAPARPMVSFSTYPVQQQYAAPSALAPTQMYSAPAQQPTFSAPPAAAPQQTYSAPAQQTFSAPAAAAPQMFAAPQQYSVPAAAPVATYSAPAQQQ